MQLLMMRRLLSSCFAVLWMLLAPAWAWAKPWKGAELITHETFKYGAFEARIRAAAGSGLVTPFFLWKDGSHLPGAEWQEQDFELFGVDCALQTQVMTPGDNEDNRTEHVVLHTLAPESDACSAYHTYRMEWTPEYVAFSVDGRLLRVEVDPVEFGKLLDPAQAEPAELRVSLWAGDWDWSGPFDAGAVPAHTFVNWIEVFDYTPGSGPGRSDFSRRWREEFNTLSASRFYRANWTFEHAVNDYVPENMTARNGYLVLSFTSQGAAGQSVAPPIDQGVAPFVPPAPAPGPGLLQRVPARLEAEAPARYLDTTPGNQGVQRCGAFDFDAELTADSGGGCNVSLTRPGEWLEWDIEVAQTARYDLVARVAANQSSRGYYLRVDGVRVGGAQLVSGLGWQAWQEVTVSGVRLSTGRHTLRFEAGTGFLNLNFIRVVDPTVPEPEPEQVVIDPVAVPGLVEAEAFDRAYDTTGGNSGDAQCGSGDVDAQRTSDPAGGVCNVSFAVAREWLEYDIAAEHAGAYPVMLRLASASPTPVSVHLELDGVDVTGPLSVPRAGWQSFSDVAAPDLFLDEGQHVLRFVFDTGSTNFNFMRIGQIREAAFVTAPTAP